MTNRRRPPLDVSSLTPRQCDVLDLIVHGHTTKQIAAKLMVAESTAKTHIRDLGVRLGFDEADSEVSGRGRVLLECLRRGWLIWRPPNTPTEQFSGEKE